MVTISSGSIAIYYSIFTFILPKDHVFHSFYQEFAVFLASIFFLIASQLFVDAYEPQLTLLALDNPVRLTRGRRRALARLRQIMRAGFATFVVATILAVFAVVSIGYGA